MKYKIEATIPTTQYGNIRPTFEVETEEEEASALSKLHDLWGKYGEKPLNVSTRQIGALERKLERRHTFTGEDVIWEEATHTYTDLLGNVLLSGSKFAEQTSPQFNLEEVSEKTSKAWGVKPDVLRDIWRLNSDIATNWGTAFHKALELYHVYNEIGETIKEKKELERNYVLPKNDYLRKAVEGFVSKYGANALSEVLVSDVDNKMAGTIDRLTLNGKKVRIGDYKTNAEMDSKKMLKYQKQLSFYASILQNKGYEVEGLDIYHLGGDCQWSLTTVDILPIVLPLG